MNALVDDTRAKKNVVVLISAQGLLGSQITMMFVIAGLAGQQMTPFACLATLPITMIVFGSMTTAPWLSTFMQRRGRRPGFWLGATGGLIGAMISAAALTMENFWLFLLGSYLTGTYLSSQGFFRFAATDMASEAFRPKAISYVMAGGLISAIIGPQIVGWLTADNPDATVMRYFPIYVVAMGLNVAGMLVLAWLDIPKPPRAVETGAAARTRGQMLRVPQIAVAMLCAAVTYALMNLVMTSAPLAVVGCGYAEPDAANVVTAHVLAMYIPSFFTGHVIARIGAERVTGLGLLILGVAGAVGLSGVDLSQFFATLILLGIGWNFGFIGATTMLSATHLPEERGRIQGLNDAIVFGSVTLASLTSGGLMNCVGSDPVAGWSAVNLAMLPLLTLAGGALIWLAARPRASRI